MESNPVQMIELLSLQQIAGDYQMAVSIFRESGRTDCVVEIDEYTYNEMLAVYPLTLGQGRIRMSLYTKWDPYRKIHYSHISCKEGELRSSLYFACTTKYMGALQRLKEDSCDEATDDVDLVPAMKSSLHKLQNMSKLHIGQQRGLSAVRWVAFSLFIIIAVISTSDKLFNEEDDPLRLSVNAASSLYEMTEQSEYDDKSQAHSVVYLTNEEEYSHSNSLATVQAEVKEEEQHYEWFDLSGDEAVYTLPKGYVALTFDDGPSAYTEVIVDILKEHKVAATFLFIGKNTRKYPDAVAYASQQKMAVGNHSWDHSNLEQLDRESKLENISFATTAIEKLTKQTNTLFRPPYGLLSNTLVEDLQKQKMKILMWNRDPEDWKAESSDAIIRYFQEVDPSGGIYVLHEKQKTVKALPGIIKYLKDLNLKFVIFE
ncbi:polysaccharide deacetylase family protein [Paenibacillus sinopodophylli]|uniref:polysaccharide deacetylase family protein n=1 Tax=Paenibacillus sinopodophylli TaxID=1837342 RepID=UPI0014865900|nr:polysaccharide deacetylase family protein [Paenibacillus sinopodophylli]